MHTIAKTSPACSGTADTPCGCGADACASRGGSNGSARTGRRAGIWAGLAAATACLVCLVPGAAVALGAAGVVALTPAGIGGALLTAAIALVAWRLVEARRRA